LEKDLSFAVLFDRIRKRRESVEIDDFRLDRLAIAVV
jgi:hypothetical protein